MADLPATACHTSQQHVLCCAGLCGVVCTQSPSRRSPPPARTPAPALSTPGFARPAVLVKNVLLINGTDGVAGVEYGSSLAYHPGWDMHVAYVSGHACMHACRILPTWVAMQHAAS